MRNDDERPRYPSRNVQGRGASFSTTTERRDWKTRPTNQPARRDDREDGSDSRSSNKTAGRPAVEDMDVFRLAHDLAVRTHELTGHFPAEERAGLGALLRHTAAAVPMRIAVGSSRWDRTEYASGVIAARDAANEARYQLLLVKDLGHISAEVCGEMREEYDHVARMLSRLARALAEGPARPRERG